MTAEDTKQDASVSRIVKECMTENRFFAKEGKLTFFIPFDASGGECRDFFRVVKMFRDKGEDKPKSRAMLPMYWSRKKWRSMVDVWWLVRHSTWHDILNLQNDKEKEQQMLRCKQVLVETIKGVGPSAEGEKDVEGRAKDFVGVFSGADTHFTGSLDANGVSRCPETACDACTGYVGRSLCKCMAVAGKFHDDQSQAVKRAEFFLGTYPVKYYGERSVEDEPVFECRMDAILMLVHDDADKTGYVVLNCPLESFKDNGLFDHTDRKDHTLECLIFLKHLFYKQRLRMTVGNVENITMQEWINEYLKCLLGRLRVDYGRCVPQFVKDAAFRYSMVELNNIKDGQGMISLERADEFTRLYANQIYGLTVSDEGWEYVPVRYLQEKLKDKYYSTRTNVCNYFLDTNALIVNQTEGEAVEAYRRFAEGWFGKYHFEDDKGKNDFHYADYFRMRPCLPGVDTLIFHIFVKAIYKSMAIDQILSSTSNQKSIPFLRRELERLSSVLETHSFNMGEIKSAEEHVCEEFGIVANVQKVKDRYKRKADVLNFEYDDLQNGIIIILTILTVIASTFSVLIGVEGKKFSDGSYFGKLFPDDLGIKAYMWLFIATAAFGLYRLIRHIYNKYRKI